MTIEQEERIRDIVGKIDEAAKSGRFGDALYLWFNELEMSLNDINMVKEGLFDIYDVLSLLNIEMDFSYERDVFNLSEKPNKALIFSEGFKFLYNDQDDIDFTDIHAFGLGNFIVCDFSIGKQRVLTYSLDDENHIAVPFEESNKYFGDVHIASSPTTGLWILVSEARKERCEAVGIPTRTINLLEMSAPDTPKMG